MRAFYSFLFLALLTGLGLLPLKNAWAARIDANAIAGCAAAYPLVLQYKELGLNGLEQRAIYDDNLDAMELLRYAYPGATDSEIQRGVLAEAQAQFASSIEGKEKAEIARTMINRMQICSEVIEESKMLVIKSDFPLLYQTIIGEESDQFLNCHTAFTFALLEFKTLNATVKNEFKDKIRFSLEGLRPLVGTFDEQDFTKYLTQGMTKRGEELRAYEQKHGKEKYQENIMREVDWCDEFFDSRLYRAP